MRKTLLLAGVACLFAAQAQATDYFSKPYVGLDLGGTKLEYSNKISGGDTDAIFVANLNFGLKFNDYFGLELSSQASSETDVENVFDLSYSSIGIDAVGYLPCSSKVELFAMAGVGYYNFDLKYNLKLDDIELHLTKNDTAFRAGLGAQYNINEKWALRSMVRYHHIDNDLFDYIGDITVGVRYNF